MEKSVLALLVLFAVVSCASGDKRANGKPRLIPPDNAPFLSQLGALFEHLDYEASNSAISQLWHTSTSAQLLDLTGTGNNHPNVRNQNGSKDQTGRVSDPSRGGHFLRSNKIDVVPENDLGARAARKREDKAIHWKLNHGSSEARSCENSSATATTRDHAADFIHLTCSLQSELGLVVHDASCTVAAVASASCIKFKNVEDDPSSPSLNINFDFNSSDARRRSAFWRNTGAAGVRDRKRSVSGGVQQDWRLAPSQSNGASRALENFYSDEWNQKAAVVVWTAPNAPFENLTLWIFAPPQTIKSTNGSHNAKSAADDSNNRGTSLCWRVKFRPAPGWSVSLFRVQGLPVEKGRYHAWVVTGDSEVVVARRAVEVSFGDQQKALKVRTVNNKRLVHASAALRPSQGREFPQDDEENIFFHSNHDEAEDLSTTSDPWRPPVVERPLLSKNLHPARRIANNLQDHLPHFKQNSSDSNASETLLGFFKKNETFHDASRDSLIDVGDVSNPQFRDVKLGNYHTRRKRSLECKECVKKMRLEHEYDATTAIFVLRMVFNCSTEGCCHKCSGTVNMQQYRDSISASECSTLPISVQSFNVLYPVAYVGNISVESPYTVELPTGCYIATVDLGEQAHHGFTWLRPHTEPPDLNAWNTTFYLQPRPLQREVEVRWTQPQYPQNFSKYSLQLWYQADRPLNCSGYHSESGDVMQVQPTPSLPLYEPVGVFEALAPGWYCARVTPDDPRCPRDGCAVRASHAVLLEDPSAPLSIRNTSEYPPDETPYRATFIAAIIGASLFVVLVTAVVAFLRFKWVGRSRITAAGPVYQKVSQVQTPPSERPCLLLVWTKRADSKGHHAAAVAALRRLLSTHFVVWDYLDLLSLPPLERDKVLENPAGWLYTAVHNPRVKVILVSSVGAERWRRAVQEGGHAEAAVAAHTDAAVPLDVQLFPYLLQLLLHDPSLIADYSKIFVVRFAKVCTADTAPADGGGEGALGGLVQGLRYSLPFHLGLLSSALLGASKKQQREGTELSYPRTLLQDFEETCQRLAVPETQPSSNFVIADRSPSEAKLSNGSVKPHRTSGDELC